ncbi:hypothetical protein DF186_14225, partial [Enterococcus hirae]
HAETQKLIKIITNNQFIYTSEKNPVNNETNQKKEILKINTLNTILTQNKILTQQINIISQNLNK